MFFEDIFRVQFWSDWSCRYPLLNQASGSQKQAAYLNLGPSRLPATAQAD